MKSHDYKLLLLSFFLLNLFLWISIVELRYGIPLLIKYILSVSILGIIIYYKVRHPSNPVPGGLFYLLIILFVLGSIVLLVSTLFNISSVLGLQRILAARYYFIPYLLPLILLFAKYDIGFVRYLFDFSFILLVPAIIIQLSIVALGLSPEEWYEHMHRIYLFDIGSSFLLLTSHISKKKSHTYVAFIYFILLTFLWLAYGRRGLVVESILLFFFVIIIRLRSPIIKVSGRVKMYLGGLFLVLLFFAFGYLLQSTYAFERGMSKSGFEESRNRVFTDFFEDFNSSSDWLLGRGLDGTVRRTIMEEGIADTVENGFLLLILKGGLIYTALFVVILLRASYLGFFKSKNDIVKALASLIFIHVVMMLYFNLPDYSTRYVLIWIFASVCFTPEMRNLSNEEVHYAINSKLK